MNLDTFDQLVKYLQSNPSAVTFDGNIMDLPDGSSIYRGESLVMLMDAEQNLVTLSIKQQEILGYLVDYCEQFQALERKNG